MARARTWMIAAVALGCGPSVILDDDTDTDGAGATSADDDRGTDSAGGSGMGPSTRGDGTSAADDDSAVKLDILAGTTGDVCIEWASMGCATDTMPGSLVHGGTPLGELPLMPMYAFFGGAPLCDACLESPRLGSVYLVTDPSVIEPLGPLGSGSWPGLELRLDAFEGPTGQEITVSAIMRTENEEAEAPAQVRIDSVPDPHQLAEPFDPSAPVFISGEVVSITGEDWSVHGTFVAAYCPQANEIWICE